MKWIDDTTEKFFTADPINNSYNSWLVEATSETEYKGMYHIDSQGRIRVEPGNYEISRMPVSRYKFVTSGHIVYDTNTTTDPYTGSFTTDNNQQVTIENLGAGKTADIHYYDEVEYYDKFSHVDEAINKFYTLDSTTKANKTIKGIRIADYHQIGTTGDNADTVDVTDNSVDPPGTTQTMTVPVANLKIYKIYVDGTEELMSSDDYTALSDTNFNITYTYDSESGDKREFGGKAAEGGDPAIPAQFSYFKINKQITVTKVSDFENGVYTLNADYKGFKATFDIVFLRPST